VNVKTSTCICWDEDLQDSRPRRRGVPTLLYGIDCDMTIILRPRTTLSRAKSPMAANYLHDHSQLERVIFPMPLAFALGGTYTRHSSLDH
jgi:hypothetical protein